MIKFIGYRLYVVSGNCQVHRKALSCLPFCTMLDRKNLSEITAQEQSALSGNSENYFAKGSEFLYSRGADSKKLGQ